MLVNTILSFLSIQKKSLHAPKHFELECRVQWIQHMDDHGIYYYEDTNSGTVTWMAPVGKSYIPWADFEA